jgi:hypothetical protein
MLRLQSWADQADQLSTAPKTMHEAAEQNTSHTIHLAAMPLDTSCFTNLQSFDL